MNGSGDFQDVESNYSGRLSLVSSQPEMIPSSRVLPSCDKRLPLLDTWNQSGVQENVFGNQFSTFDSPQDLPHRISSDDVQRNREAIPLDLPGARVKTSLTSEDGHNYGKIPMPVLRQDRWLRVLEIQWIFRRTTWSDSKDSKYRKCNSTSSLTHHHFGVKNKIQNTGLKWFWFSIGWYVMDQRSGDGWFFGQIEILAISLWKGLSKLRDARREECLCSEQDHPEFPVQEEGRPRGAESPKREPVSTREKKSPSWSSTTFEWLALMIQYWIVLICSLLLLMMITFSNSIQDVMKFCSLWQKFHPMKAWKVCTNWNYVSPRNSKPFWNCTTWDSSEEIGSQLSKVESHGEEEYRSETSITQTLTLGIGEFNQGKWSGGERD